MIIKKEDEDVLVARLLCGLRARTSRYEFNADYMWIGFPLTPNNRVWIIKCKTTHTQYMIPNAKFINILTASDKDKLLFIENVIYDIMAELKVDIFPDSNVIDVTGVVK
jgi:hypothetical protein